VKNATQNRVYLNSGSVFAKNKKISEILIFFYTTLCISGFVKPEGGKIEIKKGVKKNLKWIKK
jgi:hypothetical protein